MAHSFEQHVGEVKIRIDAASLAELFVEGARALGELMGRASDAPPGDWQPVVLTARDPEALLVAWLNELIARTEIDHILYGDVAVDDLTATRLAGTIRGVPFRETATAVKAATMHGLHITCSANRVLATVILDV